MNNPSIHVKRFFPRILTHSAVTPALVALILTALLYGDTLTLPLFSDDLVQIPWLESISWSELWTSPSPYGYYRPLWYGLWRVWGMLAGGLHPFGLHLLNLIAHFAASWLAGLLAAAWVRSPLPSPNLGRGEGALPACLTTALFAVFPFARQAIAWPGAVYNPLVSTMGVGAILAYDRGRQGRGTGWIGLALLLTALSALTYELGLLVGAVVVFTEFVGWLQRRWQRRLSPWPLAFAALLVAAMVIWRSMRGAGAIGFGLNPTNLRLNAGFLLQGLIYPAAPLPQWITTWSDLPSEPGLWLVAMPTLALLIWSGWRWNRGAFLLGAGWFVLFAIAPLVTMEADWFALAPRFLYMTTAGVALIWTATIGPWLARLRPSWRLVAIGVLALSLIPAGLFVKDGVRLYHMAGESIWDAAQAAERDHPILLVNLPLRITPRGRVYPLGFEGITPLPARVTAEELVYVHTGIHDGAEAVSFGVVAPEPSPDHSYQLHGDAVGWQELTKAARKASTVYLTEYGPDRITLAEAGAVGVTAPPGEPLAHFGERVTLLGATPTCDEAGRVHLTTHWQAKSTVETDATVFAHLLNAKGALIAQADGYPLLGMQPFWVWTPGEVVRDVRHFEAVPSGNYVIRLGLWELATGERWSAAGHADGVVLLSVRCVPLAAQ
ncbi:MAG: hypothetical protein JXA14_09740 [Anaerolineae bacterium]|nr:hypothetical protein [Anaerolineae bacterium]